MPQVSIIVPVYNVEKYLCKCIDSILHQTFSDFELILVDDGSPDNSPIICDRYAKSDNRVRVIHKKNGGLADARNAGLAIANGSYILFVDSDDYIALNMVETLYDRLKQDHSDMAICNFLMVDENGKPFEKEQDALQITEGLVDQNGIWERICSGHNGSYVIACSKLYKRRLFESVRFPVGKLHEDEFVAHHIYAQCQKISCIKEQLYFYVQHTGSIMNREFSVKKLDAAEAFYDRTEFFLKTKRENEAVWAYTAAVFYLMQGYEHLSLKETNTKERISELKKQNDKIYHRIIRLKMDKKKRLYFFVFFINPLFIKWIIETKKFIRNYK